MIQYHFLILTGYADSNVMLAILDMSYVQGVEKFSLFDLSSPPDEPMSIVNPHCATLPARSHPHIVHTENLSLPILHHRILIQLVFHNVHKHESSA
jgi:hypothetical protein